MSFDLTNPDQAAIKYYTSIYVRLCLRYFEVNNLQILENIFQDATQFAIGYHRDHSDDVYRAADMLIDNKHNVSGDDCDEDSQDSTSHSDPSLN